MRYIHALVAAASMIAAPAAASWQEASSAHFVVYSNDTPANVRAFTDRLERFEQALRLIRGIPSRTTTDAERVRVYIVANQMELRKLYGRDDGVVGFYRTYVGGPKAFVPRSTEGNTDDTLTPQQVLLHEYTHHFMYLNIHDLAFPPWFVEGFAEFHATANFEANGNITFGKPPKYRVNTVGDASILPASRLIQRDPGSMNGWQRDALYSRGWLLIHMMTFDPARKGQLVAYMNAINSGKSASEAGKVFGDLTRLDWDMSRYINQKRLGIVTVHAKDLSEPAITIRELTPGEAAVMPARLRTERGVAKDVNTPSSVVTLARRLAEPFANDAGAQNELAEAEFDAENFAAAAAAADRALAADPKSIHAMIYRGMAQAAQLEQAKDKADAHWRDARRWFLSANKLDPDNPLPLALFYQSFARAGQVPSKNSEDGVLAAYDLAPFSDGLRMTAATILLHRGDTKQAKIAIAQVAYGAHQGPIGKIALAAMTALDAGNTKDALTTLDGGQTEFVKEMN